MRTPCGWRTCPSDIQSIALGLLLIVSVVIPTFARRAKIGRRPHSARPAHRRPASVGPGETAVHEQRRNCTCSRNVPGGSPPSWVHRDGARGMRVAPGRPPPRPPPPRRRGRLGGGPVGAAPSAAASASAAAGGGTAVTFIPKQINNPYFDAAKNGADKAAARARRHGHPGRAEQRRPRRRPRSSRTPRPGRERDRDLGRTTRTRSHPRSRRPWRPASRSSGTTRARRSAPTTSSSTRRTSASSARPWPTGPATSRPAAPARSRSCRRPRRPPTRTAWIDSMKTDPGRRPSTRASSSSTPSTAMTTRRRARRRPRRLLQTHPNLKVIVAPTTVGILAAAQVVSAGRQVGRRQGHRPRLPERQMAAVRQGRHLPEFGLWSVPGPRLSRLLRGRQAGEGRHHRRGGRDASPSRA